MTGVHDTDMDRIKGYKLGAVDYVAIPVVPEILRSKVNVLIELHCQRRQLQSMNQSLAEANSRLELAHTHLQAEKNRELQVLNRNLQSANQDLAHANIALQAEIEERLRAEGALREADRHKDEFIAILAHELRNPLAPIRSSLEIMSQVGVDDARLNWSRDVIHRQIVHLTRLVDDLLDISRITQGTIKLAREPVQVGLIMARSLEAVQPLIADYRHQLQIDCTDESLVVDGDPTRLVQVLSNLLSNAIKYTDPGGRIEVRVWSDEKCVEFSVKDNGRGIPSASIGKLFTIFSRLPESQERQHDGLGIGLALVKKLVDLHGGEVSVQSAGVNFGSEFVVRLPLAAAHELPQMSHARDMPEESMTHANLKVLVADDNNDALESLAILLEIAGHQVIKASTGQQALELAEQWTPDVALLDIGMPTLNGYEVARQIRASEWGATLTLVAVSGWGQLEDKRRSLEAGFDHHLVKPVDFEAVEKILMQLSGQNRAQKTAPSLSSLAT